MSQFSNSRRSKYGNVKCRYKNMIFDSKLERDRFIVLEAAQQEGRISGLTRQVPFALCSSEGDIIGAYEADFCYHLADGRQITEDCKGVLTDVFRLKRKLFESQYKTRIHIVTKATLNDLPHVYH